MKKRIVHLTSVHRRSDTRISEKECRSLSRAGYDVHLVVADAGGDCVEQGVTIHDVGPSRNRIGRMMASVARVLRKATALGADLYHLHDPELIPAGLLLKRGGAKVVFDCHEDVPLQLLSKPYIPPALRRATSKLYETFQNLSCRHFDALIAATPAIASKLARVNARTVTIANFPLLEEVTALDLEAAHKPSKRFVYVGSISKIRGIEEMVAALDLLQGEATLDLVGSFANEALHREMMAHAGWRWVNELGWLPHPAAVRTMSQSMAGLVLFHPEPNHVEALPNKLFEYMGAGIPVISSNFDLWRKIVEGSACGICVDPLDPMAIAHAIRRLLDDPEARDTCGRNGRRAVSDQYNWATEADRLLRLYEYLLRTRP